MKRWPRRITILLLLLVAGAPGWIPLGYLGTAKYMPETHWRIRYWLNAAGRQNSLHRLLEQDPNGAKWELRHALASDDRLLKYAAASILLERGDDRGLRALVEICYLRPAPIKFDPEVELAESLGEDPELERYDSANAWWAARSRRTGR